MKTALAVAVGSALALPAAAQSFSTQTYLCDRGVEVPATYVVGSDTSLAVIVVDGRQVTLRAEPAASGVRYSWPTDAPVYVWWTKGDDATLFWKTPEGEAPILSCAIR
jgi:membrane-bound inhibitor of C-type lysozyme